MNVSEELIKRLRRLQSGDHTVIPDDEEPALWMREQIGLAVTALTAAQQSIREMEGDARRYRWLRANNFNEPTPKGFFTTLEDIDAAIDSAMDSSSPAGKK